MYTLENVNTKLGAKDANAVLSHMIKTGTTDVQLALNATGLHEHFLSKMAKPLKEKTKNALLEMFTGTFKKAIGLYMEMTNTNTCVITFHRKGKYVWIGGMSTSARKNLPEVASAGMIGEA